MPLRQYLQQAVDAAFARANPPTVPACKPLPRADTHHGPARHPELLRQYARQPGSGAHASYTHDLLTEHYIASNNGDPHSGPTSDLRFHPTAPLAQTPAAQLHFWVKQSSSRLWNLNVLVLPYCSSCPAAWPAELAGWLALGARSGEP
jgi:hypothetical protein